MEISLVYCFCTVKVECMPLTLLCEYVHGRISLSLFSVKKTIVLFRFFSALYSVRLLVRASFATRRRWFRMILDFAYVGYYEALQI